LKEEKKAKVDRFINKWFSRKLIVFTVATWGLFSGALTSNEWVTIATAYVGVQGFVDIVERIKQSN